MRCSGLKVAGGCSKELFLNTREETSNWLSVVEQVESMVHSGSKKRPKMVGCGAGGTRHTFVQVHIRDVAQGIGYGAIIEAEIPDSRKRIDVEIKGRHVKIACEVSVSSPRTEYRNLEKCLVAGYDYVVAVALESKILETIKEVATEKLPDSAHERIRYMYPEELKSFLEELWLEDTETDNGVTRVGSPTYIRGYKVTTYFQELDPREVEARRAAIAKTIVRALRGEDSKGKKH